MNQKSRDSTQRQLGGKHLDSPLRLKAGVPALQEERKRENFLLQTHSRSWSQGLRMCRWQRTPQHLVGGTCTAQCKCRTGVLSQSSARTAPLPAPGKLLFLFFLQH